MNEELPQFKLFKQTYPNQIASEHEEDRLQIGDKDWFLFTCIQYAINSCCRYKKDANKDHWRIMTNLADTGDCEEFVFTKRSLIEDQGYSLRALAPVICIANGIGHMVLCIRTTRGDYIADNIIPDIRSVQDVPYKWKYILTGDKWQGAII